MGLLSSIGALSDVAEGDCSVFPPDLMRYRFSARFEGNELDIIVENFNWSAEQCMSRADAPINAVAIDADSNKIIAHSLFMEHLKGRIYQPNSMANDAAEHSRKRYNHLREKIPGLVYISNE